MNMKLIVNRDWRIDRKKYLLSISIYVTLLITLILFFSTFFGIEDSFTSNFKENSVQLSLKIIKQNSINFFQYIVLAPIMPIFYMLDCIITAWSISISIDVNGLKETISHIVPHGIVEIPNFCLYTYVSYRIMRNFYKNFNRKDYDIFKEIKSYKNILFINIVLIIIAGLIEGILT